MTYKRSASLFICLFLLLFPFSPAGQGQQQIRRVAVLNFDVSAIDSEQTRKAFGKIEDLAVRLTDKLTARLISEDIVHIVERRQLLQILQEQGLRQTDSLDPGTIARLGRILGVDAIIIGKVTLLELKGLPDRGEKPSDANQNSLNARLLVHFRVIDTKTGFIEATHLVAGNFRPPAFSNFISRGIGLDRRTNALPANASAVQIKQAIEGAVEDLVDETSELLEDHFSGAGKSAATLSADSNRIRGKISDVSGSRVAIADINQSQVTLGDRMIVNRNALKADPITKEKYTTIENIGEVEIVEIQGTSIIGVYSGATPPMVGDIIKPAAQRKMSKGGFLGIGGVTSSVVGRPSERSDRIERYPIIACPETIQEAKEFAVEVYFSLHENQLLASVREGEKTPDGKISLPLPEQVDQKPWPIEIVLSAQDFDFLDGQNIRTIQLSPFRDSTRALFRLKSKSGIRLPEVAEISATIWHTGNYLGQISRNVKIARAPQSGQTPSRTSSALPESVNDVAEQIAAISGAQSLPIENPSPELPSGKPSAMNFRNAPPQAEMAAMKSSAPTASKWSLDLNRKSPDLTVRIRERVGTRSGYAEIEIHSPHLQTTASRFVLSPETTHWLESQYVKFAVGKSRDLHNLPEGADNLGKDYKEAELKGFGRDLYLKIAPELFRKAFWILTDRLGNRFRTIQIISDNPTIPWELMCPVNRDQNISRGFLGAEFNIGRWHLAEGERPLEKPPQIMSVDQLLVIAPKYSGNEKLEYQQKELRKLEQIPGYKMIAGNFSDLKKLLSSSPGGIIHFAGHASVLKDQPGIKDFSLNLEDGPLSIQAWQGLIPQKLDAHPFFFFNACQIGQTQRVANFVNGWGPTVLESGASGYVGALWPIQDRNAYEFSSRFYEVLADEIQYGAVGIADVLRRTRSEFLKKGAPTYLAYVFYGDPNLTLIAGPALKKQGLSKKSN